MPSRNTPLLLFGTVPCFMILVKMAGLFKVSYIIGSYAAFFSASAMVQPLIGFFGGLGGSGILFGLSLALRSFKQVLSFKILAYHIPGLCASAYWATEHWAIRLVLPVVCMVLFVVHPVGFFAAPYALYWLIPLFLYFLPYRSPFTRALGSTFVAHGVGSVMWLYLAPMSAGTWLSMIPLVAIERLTMALGMTGFYYGINAVTRVIVTGASYLTKRYSRVCL